ncbi:MAG: NUDIX hydrolase [Anaerolineales bacterium]|nr:NUDIX hydrolase [Anaerolineales bacterium]
MDQWKTISKKVILDHGKFLKVENHVIQLPNGKLVGDWGWVITPDFVNILTCTSEKELLIFRQGKYGYHGLGYAPAGGYIEPGEDPLSAAQRELLEEMGYRSSNWVHLYSGIMDPNRGVATGHLFLALEAEYAGNIPSDDLEEQELIRVTQDQAAEFLANGEFKVLAWALNIALGLEYLRNP